VNIVPALPSAGFKCFMVFWL